MFANNDDARPMVMLDSGMDLHSKIFGERATHCMGLDRGYRRILQGAACAGVVQASQKVIASHRWDVTRINPGLVSDE